MVQILREVLSASAIKQGLFAGLSHPALTIAMHAMHTHPEKPWRVDELATISHMSRAKFAHLFQSVVGHAPLQYLSQWRLRLSKDYLRAGDSVDTVANKVGYKSGSAFARVFTKHFSCSPKQWLKTQ
jgi:AraC-like DNA-binding protein